MRFNIGPCKTSFSGTLNQDELEDVQAFLVGLVQVEEDLECRQQSRNRGRSILRLMFINAPLKGSITNEE